jgi:hypothetical protein
MESKEYYYEPRNGHGLPHDPFNAIVGPRPIGWISTKSTSGVLNLAPYSFFNAFNYTPPIIGFSSTGNKDTVSNIRDTKEFVWNLVTLPLVGAMNESSAHVSPEVDEFALAGVTPAPSRLVGVPRVAESPVSFECRLSKMIQLESASGDLIQTWLTLGEVVAVHINRDLLKDGIYQTATANHVMRGGGPADYFTIGPEQLFKLKRPT